LSQVKVIARAELAAGYHGSAGEIFLQVSALINQAPSAPWQKGGIKVNVQRSIERRCRWVETVQAADLGGIA
jgi:hypothetical protein